MRRRWARRGRGRETDVVAMAAPATATLSASDVVSRPKSVVCSTSYSPAHLHIKNVSYQIGFFKFPFPFDSTDLTRGSFIYFLRFFVIL